jgi:hypothetical protein
MVAQDRQHDGIALQQQTLGGGAQGEATLEQLLGQAQEAGPSELALK